MEDSCRCAFPVVRFVLSLQLMCVPAGYTFLTFSVYFRAVWLSRVELNRKRLSLWVKG